MAGSSPAPVDNAPAAAEAVAAVPESAAVPEAAAAPAASDVDDNILPGRHWIAQAENDADSFVDSVGDETTASLRSSIRNYREINGRTYHGEVGQAEYWGPNDDRAQEGLDIHHHACFLLLGHKLHLAPLQEGIQKVLDIGTGTGIWAIDFADEFPGAEVIGTDVSPIQPSWIPPNLKFEIDDCTREWTYAENSIDYVHTRWLVGSIADWTALFKEAFKCLKPGGYLESHEPSSGFENQGEPLDQKSALAQWGKFFVKGGQKFGRPFTVFEEHIQRKAMEAAGFVDIEEREIINPVGNWPADPKTKEIAQFSEATFLEDPKGYIAFFAHALDWTTEEIEMYLLRFRRELKSSSHRAFYRHRVVWGKKPLV
ncbi:Secondary metabolism regulator LAE1 like protein [Verticillium longisporum]|uniref:Secondary metabolism regulator LAE1 like protein n=1 Tax=Verticillium longisporum TaxID=100787 RepID=A0A8I2Z2N6_VERLO|nr:Secondary metabolism regulator LAE1 like protein [Verticillium longisporum]